MAWIGVCKGCGWACPKQERRPRVAKEMDNHDINEAAKGTSKASHNDYTVEEVA